MIGPLTSLADRVEGAGSRRDTLLSERDGEVLAELAACHDSRYPIEWARPLDCGGSSNSDHSYRLSKLVKLGLAEAQQRSAWMSRGSKVYRITEAGRLALRARATLGDAS